MSPRVLSILQNAKTFLSPDELKELAVCLQKEVGSDQVQPKIIKVKKKIDALEQANWNINSVTEMLLATHFKPKTTEFYNNTLHDSKPVKFLEASAPN